MLLKRKKNCAKKRKMKNQQNSLLPEEVRKAINEWAGKSDVSKQPEINMNSLIDNWASGNSHLNSDILKDIEDWGKMNDNK